MVQGLEKLYKNLLTYIQVAGSSNPTKILIDGFMTANWYHITFQCMVVHIQHPH